MKHSATQRRYSSALTSSFFNAVACEIKHKEERRWVGHDKPWVRGPAKIQRGSSLDKSGVRARLGPMELRLLKTCYTDTPSMHGPNQNVSFFRMNGDHSPNGFPDHIVCNKGAPLSHESDLWICVQKKFSVGCKNFCHLMARINRNFLFMAVRKKFPISISTAAETFLHHDSRDGFFASDACTTACLVRM